MNKQIEKAVEILNRGGIVIFPTDTAFGIGCKMDNKKAVEKLFKIRKRPQNQAVPVLVSSVEMAEEYVSIPKKVKEELINKYWPGSLTIVLSCKTKVVPSLVRAGGKTLGVRMPNNAIILTIIEELGIPLLGTSANFSGQKTPFKLSEVDKDLIKLVDYVLDGETKEKNTSTVIDCSKTQWDILRSGATKL